MKFAALTVLLLSNEPRYCYRLKEILARYGACLHYVRTESEALNYLQGTGIYFNRAVFPMPDLFLLDTLQPDASDLHILAWIRLNADLAALPLILLVDDAQSNWLQKALDIGASSFLLKREELAGLDEILASVWEAKWLRGTEILEEVSSGGLTLD